MTISVSALQKVVKDAKAYNSVKRTAWAEDPSVKRADTLMRQAEAELNLVATALAEAEARGYARGLEEAAKEAKHRARAMRMTGIPSEINDIRANAVMTVALALEVLATTPAETQKPETGESDHG